MTSVSISPPNSLILVMDPAIGRIPDSMGTSAVAATDSCLAVATLAEHDGVTRVRLEPAGTSPHDNLKRAWEGVVEVREQVAVSTILGEVLASAPAIGLASVTVWVNDPEEPDEILIELGN